MIDVICYGIVCLDYIWRVSELPPLGGGAHIKEETTLIGGEAANTALALQRWGASVNLMGGPLGKDERGVLLGDLLRREFPCPGSLTMNADSDRETAYCACIATDDGHRTMFGRFFGTLDCPLLNPETVASARLFTIDSAGHFDEGERAVSVAVKAGVPVIAMDCENHPEICAQADTLQVSAEHLIFGGVSEDAETMLDWAREKRQVCGASVIVTRGAKGCVMADRDGTEVSLPAYALSEVVDSTGSGDVFRGGYLFGRLQGWDRLTTLQFASAAAALNCGAMGGWPGVRDVDATLEFMRRYDENGSSDVTGPPA